MAKVTLPTINSGYLSTETLNSAFTTISTAFDNTLSRDGTTPNQMSADLDMNGHTILNLVTSDDPASVITREEMQEYVDERAEGLIVQRTESFTATAGQTVFNLTSFAYTPNSGNIAVYVNGLRKFSPTDYTETDLDTITFLSGLVLSDKVIVVQNDYLATVSLPSHTHTWSTITNIPSYASRWPAWDEVTSKPATFTPAAHTHSAADITSGRLADARRGVYVQATEPTGLVAGDAGALWFW